MAQLGIDFSKVEATSSPEPLATGWYRAMMTESEMKPTSNNATTGNTMIAVKFTLLDPAFKQRPLFKNFNFQNQNQTAQDIGWGEMKALSDALNIPQPQDTVEWHNKPVLIHVKLKPARTVTDPNTNAVKEYDAQNDINGFKDINDVSVAPISEPGKTNQATQYIAPTSFINGQSPVTAVGEPWNPNANQSNATVVSATPVVANPAPAAMPAFAAPAPVVAPVPQPVVAAAPRYELTGKAATDAPGTTIEQWNAQGWTVELMLQHGYLVEVKPVPAQPAAPVMPAAPAMPAAPVAQGGGQGVQAPAGGGQGAAVPPWLAGK